ncbi:Adenylate kinase domain containing protein [Apostichopus japonicus]|uniref:adenylate kinase n=1 Tax=Stichopus japonicus TaxID=307972 RepID=A0A2G8JJ06_STIJA|nr:Adenylate kinase domain containing protein [Apostichopus japonicus]
MTSKDDTKTYLSKREIPQLFESLMTGLMYHKPEDHVSYLKQCLQELDGADANNIQWHMFVDGGKQSAPLPPINKSNSEKRQLPPKDHSVLEMKKTSPLPPIPPALTNGDVKKNLKYVFILGGPGSGKDVQSKRLAERYEGFALISVGENLRRQAEQLEGSDENWKVLSELIKVGKLVSEETAFTAVKTDVDKTLEANPENLIGFLIEGFPRTTEQYQMFEKEFGKPDMILSLESEDYRMKFRLDKRKESNLRVDDTEEAVENRISSFRLAPCQSLTSFKVTPMYYIEDVEEVFYDMANIIDGAFFEIRENNTTNNALNAMDPLPPIPKQKTNTEEVLVSQGADSEAGMKDEIKQDETDEVVTQTEEAVTSLETEKTKEDESQQVSQGGEEEGAKAENPSGPEEDTPGQKEDTPEAEAARQALVEEAVKLLEPVEDTIVKEEAPISGDKGLIVPQEVHEEPIVKEETQVLGDKGFIKTPEEKLKEATIIFVAGGPGCGKGTQCEKIVQEYGFTHLATGDLLREAASSGDERGQKIAAIMQAGALVPSEVTVALLKEALLSKIESCDGFLIDGLPRSLENGQDFEEQIGEGKFMLFFDVSDETLMRRLLKRAETSGREDDNEETIAKRLETFHNVTAPVIELFAARNKLGKVPAESSPDEVYAEVQKIFEEFNISKPGTAINSPPAELKDKKIIFVIGGPQSGKETQCEKIVERYGFTRLSYDEILRAEVASGSERGQELAASMEKGELVSQDIVMTLLKEKMLSEAASSRGYLIDGYPREVQQGEAFEGTISAESGPEEVFLEVIKLFTDVGLMPLDETAAATEPVEQKQMNFTFVIGGPGSGKKEVAKNLAEKKNAVYISAGDLIRAEVERDPEENKELADAITIGDIVHVHKMMSLIKGAIAKFKESLEFVIEGFPRTVDQAETFSKEFAAEHRVVVLSGTSEELEQNVASRAETSGRADDTGDAAKKKISSFFDSVTAVVDYYKKEDEKIDRVMEVSFKDAGEDLTNILTFISIVSEDTDSGTPQA